LVNNFIIELSFYYLYFCLPIKRFDDSVFRVKSGISDQTEKPPIQIEYALAKIEATQK